MKSSTRAFTLIELLVVIAIILVLAGILVGSVGAYQRRAQLIQAVNRLKQLSAGLSNYLGSHDGELPTLGQVQPAWGGATDESTINAWYNAVPRAAGARGLADFTDNKKFYDKDNALVIPAAKYPTERNGRPYFAIAMNSKLFGNAETTPTSSIRVQNMGALTRTVVFFEAGLPDETQMPGQPPYTGKANGYAPELAARYGDTSAKAALTDRQTNIVFADGHVETLNADGVISAAGNGHYPQLERYNGKGKVCWTLDPEANPN